MARLHERTRARRNALQVLYTSEIQGCAADEVVGSDRFLLEDCGQDDSVFSEYAEALVQGVSENVLAIDARLASTSENWSVARMPIVDRCILRLATYEMLYMNEVPVSVSINEAVELAKDFGGEDESHRFVNGVLGRIARQLEEGVTVEEAMEVQLAAAAEAFAGADAAEANVADANVGDVNVGDAEIPADVAVAAVCPEAEDDSAE